MTPVAVPINAPLTLDEFLALPEPEYDWIIPGLFERMDRLILTGEEGHGKSTLLRQIAVTSSAGLHPFSLERIEPVCTLMVDLENSFRQVRREMAELRPFIDSGSGLSIEIRPGGIDLTNKDDEKWLEAKIAVAQPALLVIGPLYKLHDGEPNEERPAKRVATILDRLRAEYGPAIIMEAHTPHAAQGSVRPKRPYGASLWKRWPEFGLHIDKYGKLTHWRPGRDERDWPAGLERGGTWPWQPSKSQDKFYPTWIMEQVSRLVEGNPGGVSKSGIRGAGLGKHSYVDQAVGYLLDFGYLVLKIRGRAHLHFSARYYREGDPLGKLGTGQASLNNLPEAF